MSLQPLSRTFHFVAVASAVVAACAGPRQTPSNDDLDQFAEFCRGPDRDATCDPEASAEFERLRREDPAVDALLAAHADPYRDDRVASAAVLAPAVVQILNVQSLESVDTPLLTIIGADDVVAPDATNASVLHAHVPASRIHRVDGAGHYTFLAPCTELGVRVAPFCRDAPGVDRRRVHDDVARLIARHFEATLDR